MLLLVQYEGNWGSQMLNVLLGSKGYKMNTIFTISQWNVINIENFIIRKRINFKNMKSYTIVIL